MKRTATLPKLLPWLAKQAGIDQDRAITLWQRAERIASESELTNTAAYWQSAMEQFRILLARESLQMDIASLGMRPLARHHVKWIRAIAQSYESTSQRLHYCYRLSMQMLPAARGCVKH